MILAVLVTVAITRTYANEWMMTHKIKTIGGRTDLDITTLGKLGNVANRPANHGHHLSLPRRPMLQKLPLPVPSSELMWMRLLREKVSNAREG